MANIKRQSIRDREAAEYQAEKAPDQAARRPRRATTTRVGTYWQHATFQEAKSAYMVDLDLSPDSPNVFARWISRAIDKHARLSPERRQKITKALPTEARQGMGVSRSFEIDDATIEAMDDAIVDDRRAYSIMENRTGFVSAAVRAAIADVKKRSGRNELPPAPARLPKNPPRS